MQYEDNTQPQGENTRLDVDNTTRNINVGAKPKKICSETFADKPVPVTNNESELIPIEALDAVVDIFKTLMKWDEELNAMSEAA